MCKIIIRLEIAERGLMSWRICQEKTSKVEYEDIKKMKNEEKKLWEMRERERLSKQMLVGEQQDRWKTKGMWEETVLFSPKPMKDTVSPAQALRTTGG